MKTCNRIEPLLYLYRDGELTAGEERAVMEHLGECPSCRAVVTGLRKLGDALSAGAGYAGATDADPLVVGRTLDVIRKNSRRLSGSGSGPGVAVRLAGRLRPAFGFAILCLTVLFCYQQAHDAYRMTLTEGLLAVRSVRESGGRPGVTMDLYRLLDALSPGGWRQRTIGPVSAASLIPWFIPSGSRPESGEYPRAGDDLFRKFSAKYPRLSGVNPYDGIDEREREILSTEGPAFLAEFRNFIKEGER
jgi:hypothetical protein